MESVQEDGAQHSVGEKENRVLSMLLAGLISTSSKSRKNERTLADTNLKMEVISRCRFGGLEEYKPSGTIIVKMKLEKQLDMVEYSGITVPDSVQMHDPAGG